MRHLTRIALLAVITAFFLAIDGGVYASETETGVIEIAQAPSAGANGAAEAEVEADAQRNYCAMRWTEQYEGQKADIEVKTRGAYDEVAVFNCPDCSLYDNFVKPFLESEYRGKTGMMRLSECGFEQAVFKGNRGTEEIIVDVQHIFPDPDRLPCVQEWSKQYQKKYPYVTVSSRGEYYETIVFSCYNCTSNEAFILPFLETGHEGKTAMDKLRRCGFTQVVFTNPAGTAEVVKEVR